MSGGTSASEGFLYQAIVSLELALDEFERSREIRVRPEGTDDLEIEYQSAGVLKRQHIQIKKPRQNAAGERKVEAWRLPNVCDELLLQSFERLVNNCDTQIWILGDELDEDSRDLLCGRLHGAAYATAVYRLARARARVLGRMTKVQRRWSPTKTPPGIDPSTHLLAEVQAAASTLNLDKQAAECLLAQIDLVGSNLPGVLARIKARTTYGEIDDLRQRVARRIASRFGISEPIARQTVLHNFRGFLDDVAHQRNLWVEYSDFELELRNILPHTIPFTSPPVVPRLHLERPRTIAEWMLGAAGATNVVASSGAGKSTFARELAATITRERPNEVVLYAELRDEHEIRDFVVGLGYKLRRRGHANVFTTATQLHIGEQGLIDSFADELLSVAEPVHVIIDFVNGRCQPRFHAALAELIRKLAGRGPRIYSFACEDPLEDLNQVERVRLGVRRFDAPGLHEGEFVELGRLHGHDNPTALRYLHRLLGGGRYAGVFPRDAVALFGLESTDAMLALVEADGNADIAEAADRRRFQRLARHIRECATQLLCFALPFSLEQASRAFSSLPVFATIRSLREIGLLLEHRLGAFEFHERVRAGLLNESRPDLVGRAHERLAEFAKQAGTPATVVYHLEQAGHSKQAMAYAREVVLGSSRSGLVDYARRHRLFGAHELLGCVSPTSEKWWTALQLLADVGVGDERSAKRLVEMIRETDGRQHYHWLLNAYETILRIAPATFDDLFRHALAMAEPSTSHRPYERALLIAARNVDFNPPEAFDEQFEANPDQRPYLLPFLMLRPTVGRMRAFVDFVVGGQTPSDSDFLTQEHARRLFVGALPGLDMRGLIANGDFNIRPFGPILWRHRSELLATAHAMLASESTDAATVRSALRLLIYYGDGGVQQYRTRFNEPTDQLLARLGPVLVGDHSVLPDERARFLNQAGSPTDRTIALMVCSVAHDPQLQAIVDGLEAQGIQTANFVAMLADFAPLQPAVDEGHAVDLTFGVLPFDLFVRVVAHEVEANSAKLGSLAPAIAVRFEEQPRIAPDSPAVALMLKLLEHEHPQLRMSACRGLQRHRIHRALATLSAHLRRKHSHELNLASTWLASYPTHLTEIEWPEGTDYWRATAADRLKIVDELPWLTSLATDISKPWQARRAAIAALARLTKSDAFEAVAAQILVQPMVLEMDDGHGSATEFFLDLFERGRLYGELPSVLRGFDGSRAKFAEFYGGLYQDFAQPTACFQLNDIGRAAAGVLWDVVNAGPEDLAGRLDLLINGLGTTMVQAAAIQGLRRHTCLQALEQTATETPYPWLVVRACVERRDCQPRPPCGWLERMGTRSFEFDPQAVSLVRNVLRRLDNVEIGAQSGRALARTTVGSASATYFPPRSYRVREVVETLLRGEGLPAAACVIQVQPDQDAADFSYLIALLHPSNDRVVQVEAAEPHESTPSFDGRRLCISGIRTRTLVDHRPWREWLRVALIVANVENVEIPWLGAVECESKYGRMLTGCLLARADGRRAADVLEHSVQYLEREIREKDFAYQLAPIFDAHIVPLIERYLWRGSVQDLTGLIRLASKLDFPEIVPCLEVMLRRLTDFIAPHGQHASDASMDDPAFMSLSALLCSPRLQEVGAAAGLLGRLRRALQNRHELISVISAMQKIPHCYTDLEAERMTVLNFRHMNIDEFRHADNAAAILFDLGRPGASAG